MGRAVALREDFNGPVLRRLAKASKDAGQSRRLLDLAEIYDGGRRTDAARIGYVGFRKILARPRHYGQNEFAVEDFKKTFPQNWQKSAASSQQTPLYNFGGRTKHESDRKTKITRRWAARGIRPIAPKDQRTKSAYIIFGAICPERGVGAVLVFMVPFAALNGGR